MTENDTVFKPMNDVDFKPLTLLDSFHESGLYASDFLSKRNDYLFREGLKEILEISQKRCL